MSGVADLRTTCPYCGVGCGLSVAADGTITGDTEHPANRGLLCSKGAALAETLDDAGRLLYPEIGGVRAGWDEAIDLVAGMFAGTIDRYGPDAVALYVSGQFLTEDYYVANKLMKGFIGTANIDTNSRLCMASSVAGQVRAFGEDVVPGVYEDIEEADLVVLVGSNAAWCHPVLYRRLAAAKEARGTKIVVIDPRRTATCDIADLHLAIRPGSDVAVFAALLLHLVESGAVDRDFVGARTTGFAAAIEAARASMPSLAEAARIADLPADDLATFFGWFAGTERALTLYSQGVNQSSSGTDKVNAIINCHLATGRIGLPGMGPLSLTGQPNAMGGREVGGLANQLAAHMNFADPADIDRVRRFWNAPRLATRPGLKAVELFDAMRDGTVKALWVLGTNPAASMPRAARVREALAACPFVVVSDCWPTDTTRFADVVLPAAGWGEKDGTVTNSERVISRQRAFRTAPGEARPDWWMLTETARRMGWEAAFPYRRPADLFREHAALSGFENDGRRVFDIGALAGISDDEYDGLRPVQWPLPRVNRSAGVSPAMRPGQPQSVKRLFADSASFPTEDGRARFVPTPYRPPVGLPDKQLPLLLNTGRIRDQWHTMTRTGRLARLMAHQREPLLDIHPEDAARLGLVEGGLARIESAQGETVLPVRFSAAQRRGEVFAAMHWTDSFSSAGPIGRLVQAATDPISGQPELKLTPVRVMPVAPLWRGLALRRGAALPEGGISGGGISGGRIAGGGYYWARVPLAPDPVAHGPLARSPLIHSPLAHSYVFDLTGWETLPSGRATESWVLDLLGAASPAPELVIYADPARGAFRYASFAEGRLDACLFLSRNAAGLPPRETLAALLGNKVDPDGRTSLLAGTPPRMASAEAGPTICACFGVGLRTLNETIASRRLTSVAEIGAALRAGTNCGSCLPELHAILHQASPGAILSA